MAYLFENTDLWVRTLCDQGKEDRFSAQRARLKNTFLSIREKSNHLVSFIQRDCPELTVHDVTHLDALWEMADMLTGADFDLNPVEAFVFGAALLFHDSGMSLAAFPGGYADVKKTIEWTDTLSAYFRKRGATSVEPFENLPAEVQRSLQFDVLRQLHARQAESLVTAVWRSQDGAQEIRVIDDDEIRQTYGPTIGKIAHSHHWDTKMLTANLRTNTGAGSFLPAEWTLNEVKVACLLRCADAAHIDERRAPRMKYVLTNPTGISDEHWRFQSKLRKPTVHQDEALIYASGNDFEPRDAQSWWLCYDTINMINRELQLSNAILEDIKVTRFKIQKVLGAENPSILSKYVIPHGWLPINTEIKVTDPILLARTLGGKNLYGEGAYAPIRELLQNAADAVRARRTLEGRNKDWGSIRVILDKDKASNESAWLHIDDNGIGMSERILTGPLIDFGKSLWDSPLLKSEFPGLETKGLAPIGKFGIGFFSVFLLSEKVRVITKPYKAAQDDAKVLEFSNLSSRSILRPAEKDELPMDFSTRISVHLPSIARLTRKLERLRLDDEEDPIETIHDVLARSVVRLVSALDISVEIQDRFTGRTMHHGANWTESTPELFLGELLMEYAEHSKQKGIETYKNQLTLLAAEEKLFGRAALELPGRSEYNLSRSSFVSVGGFVTTNSGGIPYIGVFSGEPMTVSRRRGKTTVPQDVFLKWLSNQTELVPKDKLGTIDLIKTAHQIIDLGGDSKDLPYALSGSKLITFSGYEKLLEKHAEIVIPLVRKYNDSLVIQKIQELDLRFFTEMISENIVVSNIAREPTVFEKMDALSLCQQAPIDVTNQLKAADLLYLIPSLTVLKKKWSEHFTVQLEQMQIFPKVTVNPETPIWVLKYIRKL